MKKMNGNDQILKMLVVPILHPSKMKLVKLDLSIKCLILLCVINMIFLYCVYEQFNFQRTFEMAWCKSGTRTRDLGPRDSETRDRGSLPLQNLKVRPGTYLKFKSRTTGSPSKLKSGTLIIIFPHCLTYFVLGKLILLYVI